VLSKQHANFVERLIRSRQLAHPFGLPVYVASAPADSIL